MAAAILLAKMVRIVRMHLERSCDVARLHRAEQKRRTRAPNAKSLKTTPIKKLLTLIIAARSQSSAVLHAFGHPSTVHTM